MPQLHVAENSLYWLCEFHVSQNIPTEMVADPLRSAGSPMQWMGLKMICCGRMVRYLACADDNDEPQLLMEQFQEFFGDSDDEEEENFLCQLLTQKAQKQTAPLGATKNI